MGGMRSLFVAALLLSVVSLSSVALAQGTRLGPGIREFTVNPILLSDVPLEEGQYCGNPDKPLTLNKRLALVGDTRFLNVRWVARDPGGIERQIGVDCWLNCPAAANPRASCAGFQSCSYRGPTGDHACSINAPVYKATEDNRVLCRFFDPILPTLDLVLQEREFRVVDYKVSTPPITVTVGSPVTVPIEVKSFGILGNSFTNNITALQNSNLVFVTNSFGNTDVAACGQSVRTFPSVMFLSAVNVPFSILSHSSLDSTSCSADAQCDYLDSGAFDAQCVAGRCWQRLDLNIDAGLASLPEYGIHVFALILVAAAAIFFVARRKP